MANPMDSVSIPLLRGDNYENWQMRIMTVLEAKGVDQVVYGQEFPPDGSVVETANKTKTETNRVEVETAMAIVFGYKARDATARMFLMSSLSEKYTKIIRPHKHSARAIWEAIKREHEDQDPVTVDALLHEFHSFKMEPKATISEYVGAIESMVVKLGEAGKPQEEQSVVARLCAGLPASYSTVVKAWHMIPASFKTKSLLIKNLKMEEKELGLANPVNGGPSGDGAAMKAEVRHQNGHDKGNEKNRNKKNVECYHCHKKGHMKKDCRKLKREEAAASSSSRSTSSGVVKGQGFAVVASSSSTTGEKWLLDSGASFHMSGNLHWFEDYKPHSKIPIQVGNNEYLYSLGSGTIRATSKVNDKLIPIQLQGAHYVPGVSENLFSQGAADGKGVKCIAEKGKIKLISDGNTIIVGDKGPGNLYHLKLDIPAAANIAKAERKLDEWHRALGHPDINEVKNLATQGGASDLKVVDKVKDDDKCSDCQLGKAHRSSHPDSERPRATGVLERVHADLVGPISPSSIGGSKYFLLIKDEYSSYISVYFMSQKSGVVEAFRKFVNHATIRTQRQVRIIMLE